MSDGKSDGLSYRIRFTETANAEASEAAAGLADFTGDQEQARTWYGVLKTEVGVLATNPRRYPLLLRESRILQTEVRRYLFRKTHYSVAYHAYYVIDETGEDGSTVTIFHVRHASRRPMTRAEAWRIRGTES